MSVAVEQLVFEDVWHGLYGESWKSVIVDEAFAHPAKFSRALIRKIYDHVIAEGWAIKGDSVVDPFGGVALGSFDAMRHGLHWTGCELEQKFVELGGKNIALWDERYSRMPNWGTARLIQGDSRKLGNVLSAAECCVSSPPYAGNEKSDYQMSEDGKTRRRDEKRGFRQGHGCFRGSEGAYGQSEGQLGAMKEGDHSIAISSPPYTNETVNDRNGIDQSKVKKPGGRNSQSRMMSGYGEASGQLGNLAVTSPPYNPPMSQDHNGTRGGSRGTTPSEKGAFVKYGNSEGQLEGMSMEGLDAAISSPPFPQPYTGGGGINVKGYGDGSDKVGQRTYQSKGGERAEGNLETLDAGGFQAAVSSPPYEGQFSRDAGGNHDETFPSIGTGRAIHPRVYSQDVDNVGNQRGETFWSASRLILEQLHQVLAPNAHAVFVVKAFVRDKKIVDFPAQWAQLCEAVGFRLLHHHRASLVEHSGTQGGFHEDKEIRVERKSFFRRLAEAKGSPRIDHESVLCFRRLA